MYLPQSLQIREMTTTPTFLESSQTTSSSTITTFPPYNYSITTSSTSPTQALLNDSAPNWPIYLGITLGTLGLASILSLALWIRSHKKRSRKEKRKSDGEEPLPVYQAVAFGGARVEPLPPAYSPERAVRCGRVDGEESVVPLSPPPAYVVRGRMEEYGIDGQSVGVVTVGNGATEGLRISTVAVGDGATENRDAVRT